MQKERGLLPLDMEADDYAKRGNRASPHALQLVLLSIITDANDAAKGAAHLYGKLEVADLMLRASVNMVEYWLNKVIEHDKLSSDRASRLIDSICNELRERMTMSREEVYALMQKRVDDSKKEQTR